MFAEINKEALAVLPFSIHTLGESKKQAAVNRPEGFGYNHLLWVTGGSGVFEVKGNIFTLESGEGLFMRKCIPHSYRGDSLSTMWFTFALADNVLDYMGIGEYFTFNAPDTLSTEATQLMSFANGNSNPVTRSSAGYSFIMDLFTKILSDKISFADKVIDILERKYSELLSLDDIAEELCTDKYSLCRNFKNEKGSTVMDELFKIRISKAKRFLKMSDDNVADIGMMCGFENPCYFIKRFREAVGCTPAQYRKRN